MRYGLRCRLRELATPVEVYNIQIAVGHQMDGLQPLEGMIKFDNVITRDTGIYVENYTLEKRQETKFTFDDNVIIECHALDISYLSDEVIRGPLFDHLYLKSVKIISITMDSTNISKLVKKLAQTIDGYDIKISFPSLRLSLREILLFFPKLKCLHYPVLYRGWVQDLLKAGTASLPCIYTFSNDYEKMFNFEPYELLQILQKGFKLHTSCKIPNGETTDDVYRKFVKSVEPMLTPSKSKEAPFFVHLYQVSTSPAVPSRHRYLQLKICNTDKSCKII